jgi:tRNA 2-thiouridine synthesizing protein A
LGIVVVGAIIGIVAPLLQKLGNPGNMGVCVVLGFAMREKYEWKDEREREIDHVNGSTSPTIDACGLSCPQPVIMTHNAMRVAGDRSLEVLVETGTSRDNVSRMALQEGWQVEVQDVTDGFILILSKWAAHPHIGMMKDGGRF